MKAKSHWTALAGILSMTVACKEKKVEIDSPYIMVVSPKPGQVIEDKDSVQIEATFKPSGASVASYSITVKDTKDKLLFNKQQGCDCKAKDLVEVKTSFLYDINKTSNLSLEIKALLDDGREIVEKVPFVLAD